MLSFSHFEKLSFSSENSMVNHWDPTRRELCSVDTCDEDHQGGARRVGLLGTQPSPQAGSDPGHSNAKDLL